MARHSWLLLAIGAVCTASEVARADPNPAEALWQKADARADLNREALRRTDRVLQAWLRVVDPKTGLVPQNYDGHRWTVANAAADLYSSLVMHAALVDRPAMDGVLRRAIATERRHALRIGRLPDDLNVKTLRFLREEPSLARSMYGASEWCRDGLLRITEILGPGTPWSQRLIELTDEIMERAQVPSPSGRLPGGIEVCGEMLQTLSRLHALTGEAKYRQWAERIGDHYLLDKPPQKSSRLRLRDHGGEIVSGLAELYAMTARADKDKAARYRGPLRELLDRVLAVGRAPDGMLYDVIDPAGGKVIDARIIDTWGYIYNAHLTYDLVTGEDRYRRQVVEALAVLPKKYMDHRWDDRSDDYADSIESAIVLDNRLHVDGVEQWIARTVPRMWAMQEPDGTVNRRYDDGSFGRTSVLVAWLCSQGVRADPWRDDLRLGAAARDGDLYVVLGADRAWSGRLVFDRARSREVLHLPLNYPRINELPEYYVVSRSADYRVAVDGGAPKTVSGAVLLEGLPVKLGAGRVTRIVVRRQ